MSPGLFRPYVRIIPPGKRHRRVTQNATLPEARAHRAVRRTRLKATGIIAFKPSRRVLVIGGSVTGLVSGVVDSTGPLGAAVFLSLGLPPLAYVISDAVLSIAMHVDKTVVSGATINLGPSFCPSAIAMGLAMIAGTWMGRLLIKHLPVARFRQFSWSCSR